MYGLMKKDNEWEWDSFCSKAFEQMKERLTAYPILRHPVINKPFVLYKDASNNAVGAILSQTDKTGAKYVCAYASRLLKKEECNYGITEKN
jgi:hypothetical protein